MDGFPSPVTNIGGFNDEEREDGFEFPLLVGNKSTNCRWVKARRLWFPVHDGTQASHGVFVQPASPYTSPTVTASIPDPRFLQPTS
jgi:hypothetical protein